MNNFKSTLVSREEGLIKNFVMFEAKAKFYCKEKETNKDKMTKILNKMASSENYSKYVFSSVDGDKIRSIMELPLYAALYNGIEPRNLVVRKIGNDTLSVKVPIHIEYLRRMIKSTNVVQFDGELKYSSLQIDSISEQGIEFSILIDNEYMPEVKEEVVNHKMMQNVQPNYSEVLYNPNRLQVSGRNVIVPASIKEAKIDNIELYSDHIEFNYKIKFNNLGINDFNDTLLEDLVKRYTRKALNDMSGFDGCKVEKNLNFKDDIYTLSETTILPIEFIINTHYREFLYSYEMSINGSNEVCSASLLFLCKNNRILSKDNIVKSYFENEITLYNEKSIECSLYHNQLEKIFSDISEEKKKNDSINKTFENVNINGFNQYCNYRYGTDTNKERKITLTNTNRNEDLSGLNNIKNKNKKRSSGKFKLSLNNIPSPDEVVIDETKAPKCKWDI